MLVSSQNVCASCSDSEREALGGGRSTPEGLGGGQPCSSSVGKWELLGQLREPRPASGDVPGPWPLRRWGARGPSAPGEMSSVETAKQGVGGLRTEPWDPAGRLLWMKQEPEMHPRTQLLHGGDRASQGARLGRTTAPCWDHRPLMGPAGGARLDQDHRPLMGPAGGARLDRTTAP